MLTMQDGITAEQNPETVKVRKQNKNQRAQAKPNAQSLRADGRKSAALGEATGFLPAAPACQRLCLPGRRN